MKFELEEDPVTILKQAGYYPYGKSEYHFKKNLHNTIFGFSYFHAIVDYNYPIVNLHIDTPRPKTPYSLRHTTVHKSPEIHNEFLRISQYTFNGKLQKIQRDIISQFKNNLKSIYEELTTNL